MNASDVLGLLFIGVFLLLMLAFASMRARQAGRVFREIAAFARLRRAVGVSVEAGNRLHLSLGRGIITSAQSAVGFAGLSVLDRVARAASVSDRPPIASAGEGGLAILAQDTLRGAARDLGADFDPFAGRISGLTPFSYAAGAMPIAHDEEVGANVAIGSYGSEAALLAEAGERSGSLILAGSDNLAGQAIAYAMAHEPLLGEEAFAGGAYLGAGPLHAASLRVQDLWRWLLILAILAGAVLKLSGVL